MELEHVNWVELAFLGSAIGILLAVTALGVLLWELVFGVRKK